MKNFKMGWLKGNALEIIVENTLVGVYPSGVALNYINCNELLGVYVIRLAEFLLESGIVNGVAITQLLDRVLTIVPTCNIDRDTVIGLLQAQLNTGKYPAICI